MDRIELLSELTEFIQPVLRVASGKTTDSPIKFTFHQVLERTHSSLTTLSKFSDDELLPNDHAIGLVCRSILADYLIISYLAKFPECPETQMDLGFSLYADDFNRLENHMKTLLTKGFISNEQFELYRSNYSQGIPQTVKDYFEGVKPKEFPSFAKIHQWALSQPPDDGWAKEMIFAFDLWFLFSKYEHLGWHSYDITRYKWNTSGRAADRMKIVLGIAITSVATCLDVLGDIENRDQVLALRTVLAAP